MQHVARWLRPSPMTDLGPLTAEAGRLPSDVASLSRIVQGLLLHAEWLPAYDLEASDLPSISRTTRPVGERLDALLRSDARGLSEARTPAARSVGTCRDFALTLCALLRASGTPARLRCGFAAYFRDGWEDHWVCEYWHEPVAAWRLADPQLDAVIRALRNIDFDPSDLPPDSFMTAGVAWRRCRNGEADARLFGHGDVTGLWFVKVNVVRDAYAIDNRETSDWDRWREAPPEWRKVEPDELTDLDRLADNPEHLPARPLPDWPRR